MADPVRIRIRLNIVRRLKMITAPTQIADLFSILHDGVVSGHRYDGTTLTLDVRISYLAGRIHPDYKGFRIALSGVNDLVFTTWPNEKDMTPDKLTIVSEIFAPHLGILSGEVCDDRIKIVFNQPEIEYPYCGGELVLTSVRPRLQTIQEHGIPSKT